MVSTPCGPLCCESDQPTLADRGCYGSARTMSIGMNRLCCASPQSPRAPHTAFAHEQRLQVSSIIGAQRTCDCPSDACTRDALLRVDSRRRGVGGPPRGPTVDFRSRFDFLTPKTSNISFTRSCPHRRHWPKCLMHSVPYDATLRINVRLMRLLWYVPHSSTGTCASDRSAGDQ